MITRREMMLGVAAMRPTMEEGSGVWDLRSAEQKKRDEDRLAHVFKEIERCWVPPYPRAPHLGEPVHI